MRNQPPRPKTPRQVIEEAKAKWGDPPELATKIKMEPFECPHCHELVLLDRAEIQVDWLKKTATFVKTRILKVTDLGEGAWMARPPFV